MKKKLLALYSPQVQSLLRRNPHLGPLPHSRYRELLLEDRKPGRGRRLRPGQRRAGKREKRGFAHPLADRLSALQDVIVGLLSRPQASMADFYRELGYLFGVALSPHNRWNGAKALREKWQAQIEASLYRPVLIIDEAQEMNAAVFSELRLLSSADLDSRSILLVILAGDSRLTDRLHHTDLLAHRQSHPHAAAHGTCRPQQLRECLAHLLAKAGNPNLMNAPVQNALCEHAAGNYRLLMNMANELLALAAQP